MKGLRVWGFGLGCGNPDSVEMAGGGLKEWGPYCITAPGFKHLAFGFKPHLPTLLKGTPAEKGCSTFLFFKAH